MGWFSRRKSKDVKEAQAKKEEKPAPAPYKHVPRHAGADSVILGANQPDRKQISFQHEMRMNSGKSDRVPNAGVAQMLAHESPKALGARAPSPFGVQQRSPFGQSSPKFRVGQVFTTDPDAPPLPQSPLLNGANSGKLPGSGGGYFSQRSSRDLPPPTRSSMRSSSQEPKAKSHSGYLPELSLGEDLSEEPAFSEAAMSDYGTTAPATSDRNQGMSSSKSEDDGVAGASRTRSWSRTRSFRSRIKQTRFEDTAEPAPISTPVAAPDAPPAPSAIPDSHEMPQLRERYSLHLPEVQHPVDREAQSQPEGWQPESDPRDMQAPEVFSEDMQQQASGWGQSDPPSEFPYSQPQPTQLVSPMMEPVAPAQHLQPFSRPMSPALSQRGEGQLYSSSASQRSSMPPLSILEGLKVNKRGTILDEEGDQIGELVEGDLMDCVRQKANANGEVLDEQGAIVGRVVTVAPGTLSPYPYAASPAPVLQYTNGYFQSPNGMGQQWLSGMAMARRGSDASAMQNPNTHNQLGYAQTTEGMAPPQPHRHPPDYSNMVELDASEIVQAAPVLDHSDIFLPDFQRAKSVGKMDAPSGKDAGQGVQQPKTRETPTRPQRTTSESFFVEESKKDAPMIESQPRMPGTNSGVPSVAVEEAQVHRSTTPTHAPQPVRPSNTQPLTRSQSDNTIPPVPRESSRRMVKMDSVPEMTTAEGRPGHSSALFSYKGNIPMTDGPGVINVHGTNGKPTTQRSVTLESQNPARSAASPFSGPPTSTTHTSYKPPLAAQRLSQHGSLQTPRQAMKSRYSTNQPLVRSPLSSHRKCLNLCTLYKPPN